MNNKIVPSTLIDECPQCGLSTRTRNCLRKAGYSTIEDIFFATHEELLKIELMGRKSLNEIITLGKKHGLDFEQYGQHEDTQEYIVSEHTMCVARKRGVSTGYGHTPKAAVRDAINRDEVAERAKQDNLLLRSARLQSERRTREFLRRQDMYDKEIRVLEGEKDRLLEKIKSLGGEVDG